ncbi:MAG: hypothetical protein A2015_07400 [Spirochaetes bacterium GWF1_31_7]|nr:MAG: hypothetical protein A2Y30_02775 [Spirochaetes bacterium GWE1_32_154]OHD47582.1 MAG: hypothetical protein A2Y29_00220 [Spirochaetes bacterium GWE2_31_10]OHD51243.1 MAG: hypothetical protein A2015_07400 [Spirochaetes bacterium GWF1_31_7]OHD81236.1 MAG: hypothetical protein A2355_03455 [Spirochaetes bacterium RIFOXYB1_FULL_32_8]HBD96139.1 hypothetical protein [Spirochaetia bacterium]
MKKIIVTSLYILLTFTFFSQGKEIPKVLKLEWGSGLKDIQRTISTKEAGLSTLKFYQTVAGKDELTELRTSSQVRYVSTGSPFLNIPSDVIFTFYNSNNTIDGLKLAKVEVYLKKRYADRSWVNTKSVFKSLISFFCENYEVTLKQNDENMIFTRYDYEIIINGIYVTFAADIGNNRLSADDSIYFTYENNNIKNMILKKDLEVEKEKLKMIEIEKNRDPNSSIKGNL